MRIKDFEPIENIRGYAASQLGIHVDDVEYFAWEQTFGSSLGPHHGIGGQSLTKATIHMFRNPLNGDAMIYCDGVWKRSVIINVFDYVQF